jgi:hypothetical protein
MTDLPVEGLLVPLIRLAMGGFIVVIFVWAIVIVRQSLTRQKEALSRIDESMAISRRSIENQQTSIALTEQSIKNQEEIIRLLQKLVDRQAS